MMFKTVSLPAETWQKIVRRLTVEVGADDDSRRLAGAITEQIGVDRVSLRMMRDGARAAGMALAEELATDQERGK